MNYKLKKIVNDQQVAKYYGEDKNLASKRLTKGWELIEDKKEPDCMSQSLNTGELGEKKIRILIDDTIEFFVPEVGLANQIVEKCGKIYKSVKAFDETAQTVEEIEARPDDGGI